MNVYSCNVNVVPVLLQIGRFVGAPAADENYVTGKVSPTGQLEAYTERRISSLK